MCSARSSVNRIVFDLQNQWGEKSILETFNFYHFQHDVLVKDYSKNA